VPLNYRIVTKLREHKKPVALPTTAPAIIRTDQSQVMRQNALRAGRVFGKMQQKLQRSPDKNSGPIFANHVHEIGKLIPRPAQAGSGVEGYKNHSHFPVSLIFAIPFMNIRPRVTGKGVQKLRRPKTPSPCVIPL